MNEKLYIRFADEQDAEPIAAMGRTTFKETYGKLNPRDSVEEYINTMFSPPRMKEEMNTKGELFIISFLEEKAVGIAKLSDKRCRNKSLGRAE